MNIWYISKYSASPKYSHLGRHFFYSKYLAKKGADVTLIGSRSNGTRKFSSFKGKNQIYYESEGVNGVILNGPLINLGFNVKRIFSWLEFELRLLYWAYFKSKVKPDVIIVSSLSILTFLSGKILKKKFHCKLICEVRDIWPLTLMETKNLNKSNIIIRYLSYIERTGYKYADVIVGSMGNLKSHVVDVNPAYGNKVEYLPTGFDSDFYVKDKEVIKQTDTIFSRIPKDNFVVGYAGTIGLVNCVDEIIEMAYKMRDDSVNFVIFGRGILEEQLVKKVKDLKLENVIFGGYYPKSSVPYILEKCDVLLHPCLSNVTLYEYGVSPNKWIDYMYSGRPIIVALDGYKNIINEAECGVFVKAGDISAMEDAVNYYRSLEKEELNRIGNNGKEYLLNNLTYDILANKYLAVINSIMS